jgi:Tfp pilus assembly protein PilF
MDNPHDEAVSLNDYGFSLFQKNDLNGAEDNFKRALALDSSYVNAMYNYAGLLEKKNDLKGADAMYKRALEVGPSEVDTLCNYGSFLLKRRNDPDAAEAMFGRALAVKSDHVDTLGNYGVLLFQKNDLRGAESKLAQAVKADASRQDISAYLQKTVRAAMLTEKGKLLMRLHDKKTKLAAAGAPLIEGAPCCENTNKSGAAAAAEKAKADAAFDELMKGEGGSGGKDNKGGAGGSGGKKGGGKKK